jgi:hypothetical protein
MVCLPAPPIDAPVVFLNTYGSTLLFTSGFKAWTRACAIEVDGGGGDFY